MNLINLLLRREITLRVNYLLVVVAKTPDPGNSEEISKKQELLLLILCFRETARGFRSLRELKAIEKQIAGVLVSNTNALGLECGGTI